MAHELDMSNGRANMMYAGRPGWHGLGEYVGEDAVTAEEAIVAAGLDFEVKLLPTYAAVHGHNEETGKVDGLIPVPDNFAVTRMDTHTPLSIVGSKYTPIQNKECFEFMDAIAGPGKLVRYNTAGSLHGGKKIWLLAELTNLTIEPVPGDTVVPYLALIKGHDGITPLRAFFTSTRIVCQNTANLALDQANKKGDAMVNIRHTSSAMGRVDEAQRILGLAVEKAEKYGEFMQHLAGKQVNGFDWAVLLNELFPIPELEEGKTTSRAVTIATKKHDLLTELFESGLGTDIPGVRGTAWGAYNAITEYTTHHAKTRTGVDKADPNYDRARNENLLASSWFGSSAKINRKALELLGA